MKGYPIRKAAEFLGVHRRTVYRLIDRGILPVIPETKPIRISMEDITSLLVIWSPCAKKLRWEKLIQPKNGLQ